MSLGVRLGMGERIELRTFIRPDEIVAIDSAVMTPEVFVTGRCRITDSFFAGFLKRDVAAALLFGEGN